MAISKFEILKGVFKTKDGLSWNELSEMLNECWTEERIIDFINWYLKVHKLSDRYYLENKTLIESFERGDSPQMWCDGTYDTSKHAALPISDVSNCIGCLHQYKSRDFKDCKTCTKNSNYTTI